MMFYRETKFQDTPIGKIPTDWDVYDANAVTVFIKDGTHTPPKRVEKGFPLFSAQNVVDGKIVTSDEDTFIKEIDYQKIHAKYEIEKNDVLLTIVGTIGNSAIVDLDYKFSLQRSVAIFRPELQRMEPHFLHYIFQSKPFKRQLLGHSKLTTQGGIYLKELSRLKIPVPTLSEQQAIVGVLGVVDLAVAKAGEVIAKTERLKKGLMQELLTKGIGHTEYKQTPIGKTPKTWEVVKLQDVAEIRGNKSINDFERIAFIPMELVPESQTLAKYQIRRREDVRSSTYCEAGDLLLAKITPSLENGKQGIVPSDVPNGIALATTEVFPIHCKGISKFFLFYVLKFSKFRNKIISSMIGTTGRQRASKEGVERLEIPLPPIDEQRRIAEIFSSVDKKLELERNEKSRLERIKRGLMDLLLTGKVRVKVD